MLQGDQNGEDEDPMARVEKIFEQMDTDKDNKLTMAEFMEGSRNDPRIVQALSLQPDTSLTWARARDCVLLVRCVYLLLFKSFKSKCAHHRINENKIKRKVPWNHFYLHYLFVKKIQFIRIFFNKLLTLFSRAAPMGAGGGGGGGGGGAAVAGPLLGSWSATAWCINTDCLFASSPGFLKWILCVSKAYQLWSISDWFSLQIRNVNDQISDKLWFTPLTLTPACWRWRSASSWWSPPWRVWRAAPPSAR